MQRRLALLFLALAAPAQGQSRNEQRGLIFLDKRIQQAMVAGDTDLLSRALSPDFQFRHSDGSIETKADVLRSASRSPKYYLNREVRDAKAEVHGSAAIVRAILSVKTGPENGATGNSGPVCYALKYVHAFVRRDRRWQLVSHSTTSIIEPERAC